MKAALAIITVLAAVVAGYFGARKLSGLDLGFSPAKSLANSLASQLLHTEQATAKEVGLQEVA